MANIYGATLATGGTVEDIAAWPDRIKAITPAQVQAAAAKYLDPDKAVTGYLLPSAETAQN
jgi:zinc protease